MQSAAACCGRPASATPGCGWPPCLQGSVLLGVAGSWGWKSPGLTQLNHQLDGWFVPLKLHFRSVPWSGNSRCQVILRISRNVG